MSRDCHFWHLPSPSSHGQAVGMPELFSYNSVHDPSVLARALARRTDWDFHHPGPYIKKTQYPVVSASALQLCSLPTLLTSRDVSPTLPHIPYFCPAGFCISTRSTGSVHLYPSSPTCQPLSGGPLSRRPSPRLQYTRWSQRESGSPKHHLLHYISGAFAQGSSICCSHWCSAIGEMWFFNTNSSVFELNLFRELN